MNEEWAIGELQHFIAMTELVTSRPAGGVISGLVLPSQPTPAAERDEIVAAAEVVERILQRVLPHWRRSVPVDLRNEWAQPREAAQRAVVALQRSAEVAEMLGDNAPTMNAGGFHPWAWDAARSLWQSGHYREAVRAASVKINAELQNKVGRRDISEIPLFQHAFSNDAPASGGARLRPAGDDDGKTSRSERRGIVALAEGLYGAFRNPASHDEGEISEQVALEQLAAFSLLARAVDDARLETNPTP